MRTGSRALALTALCSFLFALSSPAFAAILADSPDDVCALVDDPCIVDEEVQIAAGAVLDFGQRTLRIEGDGVLDFGDAPAKVRCGKLEVDVAEGSVAIRATGTTEPAGMAAVRRLEVVRQCSEHPRDCFSEADCDLGSCGVRRCTLEPDEICLNDGSCNLGACQEDGRCQFRHQRHCGSNADCQAGPCAPEFTCREADVFNLFGPADGPVTCESNADCSLGDCAVGDGSAHLDGSTELELIYPNDFLLRTASDITVDQPVEITGREGQVELVSESGDVRVNAEIRSSGQRGVLLFLQASRDVIVDAPVGGDGDNAGGQIGLWADRDLFVHADVVARTLSRRDNGGQVFLHSGQDTRVEGGVAADPIQIHGGNLKEATSAAQDDFGGWVNIDAYRDLFIDEHTEIRTEGNESRVGAYGYRDVDLRGAVSATTSGDDRSAASAWILAGRSLDLAATSSFDIAGDDGAMTGSLTLESEGTASIAASIRFSGATQEFPVGDEPPNVRVIGCLVRIGSETDLVNTADDSSNRILARGGLTFEDGASWICDDCPNVARVRSDQNPLTLAGTIDPPMDVNVDSNLDACANCGDAESGELELCDDGIGCTEDFCNEGTCDVLPDDSACDDALFCNGAEICSIGGGCEGGPPVDCSSLDEECYVGTCNEATESCVAVLADGASCDDGDECTTADLCRGDLCKGRRDVACGDCGSSTIEWGEGCDDGDTDFEFGDLCSADCQQVGCGHPTGSTGPNPTAADALFVLRVSVQLVECALEICDANESGGVETVDALLVLRSAVGLLTLSCSSSVP